MFPFGSHRAGLFAFPNNFVRFGGRDTFVKILVAHHHRRRAAAGETLHEFDRELSVLRRLHTVRVRVEPELGAKVFV